MKKEEKISENYKLKGKIVIQRSEIMPKASYSAKQRKLAAVAPPRDKITGADLKKLNAKKKKKRKKK